MSEQPDVNAEEITPEQFDGEQEAPKAESSPAEEVESKEESQEEPKEETENTPEVVEEESQDEEPSETEGEEEPAEETKPFAKAEERKAKLNSEIRDLVAQRNALKEQVEKANSEVYQPATEDELVEQGMTPTDAKVEALRQRIEVREYNDKITDAQLNLASESQRVLDDFPIFNPDSPQFKEELAQEAASMLEANLIIDPNTGQVIGSNISPYKFYSTLARAAGISTREGQIQGQKAVEKMLANADTKSSASKPVKKTDPLQELWSDDL